MPRKALPLLAALAAALLALPDARACRIVEPRPIGEWRQPVSPIETRSHTAKVVIKDQVAEVTLEAVFYNPNGARLEGTYFLPLPDKAEISSFAMTMNGAMVEGELLDAAKARAIYEGIVQRQMDPGLLEFVGEKMLKARVFPIEPQKEIKIQVTYTQVLERDGSLVHFRYPLKSARPAGGSIGTLTMDVSIEAKAAVKSVYSPTHAIDASRKGDHEARAGFEASKVVPDKDFELYYSLSDQAIGCDLLTCPGEGSEDGYFMMMVNPPIEQKASERTPKDLVLIADTSGSMAGDKIKQAKAALAFVVNNLEPEDRFNIVAFSTEVRPFKEGLVAASKENLEEARTFIEDLRAVGGTAIDEALETGLKMVEGTGGKNLPMVLFLTDGLPTVGETDVHKILRKAAAKAGSKARVFAFGVGFDVNTDLLDRLAEDNKGAREYVTPEEDIEVKVSNLYTKVASPALSDLKLDVANVELTEVFPRALPDLFQGGQLMVLGRYKGKGEQAVKLKGTARGEEKTLGYKANFDGKLGNSFLKRQWARAKVSHVLGVIRQSGESKELVDEVTDLGKKYGILTPYTSFLVVEDGAMGPLPDPAPGVLPMEPGDVAMILRDAGAAAEGAEKRLTDAKKGEAGVSLSKAMANAQGVLGGGPPPAAPSSGEGQAAWRQEDAYGFAEKEADALKKAASMKIRRIGDKTFYYKADGFWTDSAYDEKAHKEKTRAVKSLSKESFDLLLKVPSLGKFMAENLNLVVVIGDEAFRIEKADEKK